MVPYGRVIAASRILAGWTQAELSAVSGVAERTLRRLEQGDSGVSMRAVAAILRALAKRGIEVSSGNGPVRSSINLIKGSNADLDYEDELLRGSATGEGQNVHGG